MVAVWVWGCVCSCLFCASGIIFFLSKETSVKKETDYDYTLLKKGYRKQLTNNLRINSVGCTILASN